MAPAREPSNAVPSPLENASIAGQAVDLLLFGASLAGIDLAALVADIGLPPVFLQAPPGPDRPRVPARRVLRLWAELAIRSEKEHFGLWLAHVVVAHHGETLGGHLVRSAPTLGEGLRRMIAVERVFHGIDLLSLEREGPTARLAHRAPLGVGPGAAPAVDFGFAWTLLVAHDTTGRSVRATAVHLMRRAPEDVRPWVEAFGVEPSFGADLDVLELPSSALDLAQTSADALLGRLVEGHARALLEALPAPPEGDASDRRLVASARAFVGRCIAESRPEEATLSAFARREGVASRTLQRRFAALGTRFADVADAARADLARHHLRAGASLAETAVALGFGDQAAFHRAFVRWEGRTPGAFARQARRPPQAP